MSWLVLALPACHAERFWARNRGIALVAAAAVLLAATNATTALTEAELEAVGPVRNILRVDCPQFQTLAVASENNMAYDSSTATNMPNRMTNRLLARLKVLASLVQDDMAQFGTGAMLRVLSAYVEPPENPTIASTHYEGRAADVTLVGSPTAANLEALQTHATAAGFDWISMEVAADDYPAHLHVSVIQDSCSVPIDLVFLLDGSGSIQITKYGGEPGNFDVKMLGFVKEMINFFTIGETGSRVGIVTFSSAVTTNFQLNRY